ncbi:helix-turn-helix domain-containing protein [Catenuloplanes atrovinosus]|uniref:Transcriptional regulator with XRE-family HTH domain n=1 Tax=Catenuloplanes atrovinosus TaxID=137266 RepID=A0AAE3YQQ5_9ACTN|nr:helix-turn-helix transcriptional regulator [Catenuloplanes atrovinosus]MDR7277507.1 transcriptional regulator with XRE-family HTH domain [Catenuloplanes atrovinosus]
MPRNQSAAVSRRRLRTALRRLRVARDMTQKEVADALRWSSAKLMRIEAGKVSVSFTDLQALLNHYGVTDPARIDTLNELSAAARSGSELSARYRDVLSPGMAEFVEHEESAGVIRNFQPQLIPGLLQTREYAYSALRFLPDTELPAEVVERRVEARLERAELLRRDDSPDAFFILDESALYRRAGAESGADGVLAAQLEHLRELGARPHVSIQVLPFAAGLYGAIRSPFVILEFDDELDDGLVYIESPQDEMIIREDVESIVRFADRFRSLEKRATSREMLPVVIDAALKRLKSHSVFA